MRSDSPDGTVRQAHVQSFGTNTGSLGPSLTLGAMIEKYFGSSGVPSNFLLTAVEDSFPTVNFSEVVEHPTKTTVRILKIFMGSDLDSTTNINLVNEK
jgi:hypothetical protein